MRASDPPWGSPPNGYELLKIEIEFFIQNYVDAHGKLPTNDVIQHEACRVIFAADASTNADLHGAPVIHGESWLRDLILSSPELTRQARFGPIRTSNESRHSPLKINGKDHLFEQCPLEARLRAFVVEQQALGLSVDDGQLQARMCEIVRQMEKESVTPSDMFANWLVKGIYSGSDWVLGFKLRAGVFDAPELPVLSSCIPPPLDMAEWTNVANHPPSLSSTHMFPASTTTTKEMPFTTFGEDAFAPLSKTTIFDMQGRPKGFLPEDTNYFRIFESDIRRWVAATMSPKNPNCHVPSDQEIQHQARWIMYDGDDSWNQTPADYAEWLWRFKRDVGILNEVDSVDPAQLLRH
jgi:hypothetical protein